MKTKVTRRGDNWLFFLEARVSYQYVLKDPELEAYTVMKKMDEIANTVFDDALAAGKCRRASKTQALLAWDKSDPETAGHPWAEPDVRDDFPGYCCWPGCDELSATNGTPGACLEHAKHVCPECGWLRLPGSGCKCPKNDEQAEIELKKRHPRKPLELAPCPHSPTEKTDCAACRISRAGLPTPCDEIASRYEKLLADIKTCESCGMPYRTTCWKCGEPK